MTPRTAAVFFVLLGADVAFSQTPASPTQVPLEAPRRTWSPSPVKKPNAKGLEALAREVEHAWQDRHLDDAAALMAFPILMVTDAADGRTTAEPWTRERWLRVTGDFINQLPPKAKLTTTRRTYNFVTDRLASIHEERQLISGGRTTRWRTTYVCILQNDRWVITSVVEGGWAEGEDTQRK